MTALLITYTTVTMHWSTDWSIDCVIVNRWRSTVRVPAVSRSFTVADGWQWTKVTVSSNELCTRLHAEPETKVRIYTNCVSKKTTPPYSVPLV